MASVMAGERSTLEAKGVALWRSETVEPMGVGTTHAVAVARSVAKWQPPPASCEDI